MMNKPQTLTNQQNRTRRDLILAMQGLLATTAFENITTKQIYTRAMVHHSTFYRYFTDKYDLLGAVLQELCAQIDAQMSTQTEFVDALTATIQANRLMFQNITTNHAMYYELIQIISKLLLQGAQTVATDSTDTLLRLISNSPHPTTASYSFAGMLVGVLVKWTEDPSTNEYANLKQFITDTLADLNNMQNAHF